MERSESGLTLEYPALERPADATLRMEGMRVCRGYLQAKPLAVDSESPALRGGARLMLPVLEQRVSTESGSMAGGLVFSRGGLGGASRSLPAHTQRLSTTRKVENYLEILILFCCFLMLKCA